MHLTEMPLVITQGGEMPRQGIFPQDLLGLATCRDQAKDPGIVDQIQMAVVCPLPLGQTHGQTQTHSIHAIGLCEWMMQERLDETLSLCKYNNDMKHDMIRRYGYIETQLLWGEGVTAGELGEQFGIARQNAQQTVKQYRQAHPGQMRYDRKQRRHVMDDGFQPAHIKTDATSFLNYQRGHHDIALYLDEPDWMDLAFENGDRYIRRRYDTPSIRLVLAALRQKKSVAIQYWSKYRSGMREISPHTLVFADGRYHLRAYCHLVQDYLDFVLSRITQAEPAGQDWVSAHDDSQWHHRIDLHFRVNPDLPQEAQAALALDYLAPGQTVLVIPGVRQALALYVRRQMTRVDWQYQQLLWLEETT